MTEQDEFSALIAAGKYDEARAYLDALKAKTKNSPTSVTVQNGKAVFKRGNRRVEQQADGTWQYATKSKAGT
jgi:hypothetical protein